MGTSRSVERVFSFEGSALFAVSVCLTVAGFAAFAAFGADPPALICPAQRCCDLDEDGPLVEAHGLAPVVSGAGLISLRDSAVSLYDFAADATAWGLCVQLLSWPSSWP